MFAKKLIVMLSESVRRSFSLSLRGSYEWVNVLLALRVTFEVDRLCFCLSVFAAPALLLLQTSRLINNVSEVLSHCAAFEVV